MNDKPKCLSCGDTALRGHGYCGGCRRAIEDEARDMGISFEEAALRLNASRTHYGCDAHSGGPKSYGNADWDYHGERRYDV